MVLSDDTRPGSRRKGPCYLLQSLGWSYHAPYAGHDGIQLAVGQVFKKGEDFLFPYYRDMLTVLSAGMTPEEIILNGISKATDLTGGGRHMSKPFCKNRMEHRKYILCNRHT